MPMSEKKLQSSMVLDFSQKLPNYRGRLFAVRNDTFSRNDAMSQKALGMVPGVSDLIHFDNAIMTGIEVKEPGKRHDIDHIRQQWIWGQAIEAVGGRYYIVTTLAAFWAVINYQQDKGIYTLEMIKDLLDQGKKTIIFN